LRVGVDEQCKWRFDQAQGEIIGSPKSEVLASLDDLCVCCATADDLAAHVMTVVVNNNQVVA
jgi:hypothetical protein